MCPRSRGTWVLIFLVIVATLYTEASSSKVDPFAAKKKRMSEKVRQMFYHAYGNYMTYAFPHDELKPLTKTFTDSLIELGNLKLERLPQVYNGSALTLIESLSSLAILGNDTEFERAVHWLSENLTFDVDARINLFECNIRVLGGLVAAHILATDSTNRLTGGTYKNQLLVLAEELGQRFLPAFDTPTGLPYAWINLKYGVMENEITETSTSGCGVDSFYEYLLKAHILFGREELWNMFQPAYLAVQKYFRHGPWYHEADMRTGRATYWQLTSLQAFWPGLQVLIGDVAAANSSHREFFYIWQKFGVLPERCWCPCFILLLSIVLKVARWMVMYSYTFRYLLDHQMLHPTEKYYPLRPELAESTFYLYQATKDPWYLEVGESIVDSLNFHTRVEGGFASIRDVTTMELEDHQHSFFLAETCKYLYLLFDDSFLVNQNYVFTTEGHPLPILSSWHERLPEAYIPTNWTVVKSAKNPRRASAMSLQICPAIILNCRHNHQLLESACHIPDAGADHRCLVDEDCGVDSTSCRRRLCSSAGYCGIWQLM